MKKLPLFLLLMSASFILVGCSSTDSTTNPTASPSTDTGGHSIEYQVTGSASTVSLTYGHAGCNTATSNCNSTAIDNVTLPWTLNLTANSGDFVYVSARNNGDSGTVVATILEDGNVFHISSSSGAHTTADASGMLP